MVTIIDSKVTVAIYIVARGATLWYDAGVTTVKNTK